MATPQKGETFFTFATRLEQVASSIEVPQQLAPKCPVGLKEWLFVPKLISSVKKFNGLYKAYEDRLSVLPTKEWANMTSEDILCQMRQVQDNTFQMQDGADGAVVMHARGEGAAPRKTRATEVHTPQTDAAQSQGRGRSRTRGASRGRGRSMSKAPSDCPRNVCWDSWEGKPCHIEAEGKKCKFEHKIRPASEKKSAQECGKCGGAHKNAECKFSGACDYCKKEGHTAKMCRKAKSQPRQEKAKKVNLAVAAEGANEGREVRNEFEG